MRTYQSGPRLTTTAHLFQIAHPARSAKTPGLFKAEGPGGEHAQRQVDGFALGSQPIAAHDGGAGFVVDIHVGA